MWWAQAAELSSVAMSTVLGRGGKIESAALCSFLDGCADSCEVHLEQESSPNRDVCGAAKAVNVPSKDAVRASLGAGLRSRGHNNDLIPRPGD